MIRQYELVERVRSYDPQANELSLNRAYVFSMKAHGSQTRASGDPYFSHPLEVAGILTDMRLDCDTIVTALLHDTVEDTLATVEQIRELFGPKVAELVDGVTKLSRIEIQTESARQAENFRKFLLAMSNDIRVLLVKLADRLHNMRTLHFIKKPEKRRRIALETMEIYAPLAARIGMQEMKDELEDLAFAELDPEALETIQTRLTYLRKQGGDVNREVTTALSDELARNGIDAEVSGREKRPYSIWRKMERYHVPFEQLSDVMAFRIIVADVPTCYQALGIVHGTWPTVPGRFKDYISTPKRNGYRSIHTTVIGPRQLRVEIQIRTADMHREAELGVAAHWQYKDGAPVDGTQYRWIRDLLEILDHAATPEEFLEHTKLAMFHDQVFCFTPKGDLVALPRGSTTVDFAYAVHTEVGDHCVGAKVNGRLVPLRHQLQNGDQVEVLTSKGQSPSPGWESFVITGKARSAIRRHVRNQQRTEYIELGKTMLDRAYRRESVDVSAKAVRGVLTKLKAGDSDELYERVGLGLISERDVLKALFPGIVVGEEAVKERRGRRQRRKEDKPDHAVPIRGLTPGLAVHLSNCCHPLPGDRIVGIIEPGQGVMVHTIDCEVLGRHDDQADRWLDLSWHHDAEEPDFFIGRLRLVTVNEAGTLAAVTTVVAKQAGNITNLKMIDRDPEFFTMLVDVEVRDLKHLTDITTALRALKATSSVERLRG